MKNCTNCWYDDLLANECYGCEFLGSFRNWKPKAIGVLRYDCIKCGQPEIQGVMPVAAHGYSEERIRFLTDLFDSKLCVSCYTGTDKRVAGAADSIEALIFN